MNKEKGLAGFCLCICIGLGATRISAETARVSWWGFDPQDSTRFLQAAIHSRASRLIVDKMPSPWVTDCLHGVSDQEIIFEKGAEVCAKPGSFQSKGATLLTLHCVTNVTLTGYGATLRMRRSDYAAAPYAKSEWRHALSILSCKNITVRGLTLAESGGDGIYVGCVDSAHPDTDITILDVLCDKNYRQGISVISADGLRIERTIMRDTAGTPPAAGIDFEPNGPGERIRRCIMRDCLVENNQGDGFAFYLAQLDANSKPIDITLKNCRAVGNRSSVSASTGNSKLGGTVKGALRFSGCTFENSQSTAISLHRILADGMRIAFTSGCIVSNAAALKTNAPSDIVISSEHCDASPVGGISFDGLTVYQPAARNWLSWRPNGRGGSLEGVTGKVKVVTPDGRKTTVRLSDEWFEKTFPHKVFPLVPRMNVDYAGMRVTDPAPGTLEKFKPIWIRDSGRYVFYVEKNREIHFRVQVKQVGKYAEAGKPLKFAKLDGTHKIDFPAPTFAEPAKGACTATVEKGFYTLDVNVGQNAVALMEADAPVAVDLTRGTQNFLSSEGTLYFPVPENSKRFAVGVCGSGDAEKVAVAISAPDGKQAWKRDAVSEWEQFTADSAKAGVWSCRVGKPASGVFEDFNLDLYGVPGFFFLSRIVFGPAHDSLRAFASVML